MHSILKILRYLYSKKMKNTKKSHGYENTSFNK